MSKILLINLSLASDDSYTVGPLTLLTALKSAGVDGDFYDNLINSSLQLESPEYFTEAFANDLPITNTTEQTQKIYSEVRARITDETKVIGFCMLYTNEDVILYFARLLKKEFPHLLVFLGGPHLMRPGPRLSHMENFPFVDCFVKGRAEEVVTEIFKTDFDFPRLRDRNGLCFKDGNEWHYSPVTNEFLTFEPIPYHDRTRRDVVNVSFSVGCPYKCTFCDQELYYKEYIRAPVEKCIEILKPLKGKNVFITDALLNANHVWLRQLCEEMIRLDLNITWGSWFRIAGQLRDIEFLELLYRSGCRRMDFGLESGSAPVLKHMMKYHSEEGNFEVFNNIRKLARDGKRMGVGLNILVGYPTETERDFMKTYNFILFNHDIITMISSCNTVAISSEGRLYEMMMKTGEFNWVDPDNWASKESTPAIRFDRLKRMRALLDRLKIHVVHSHDSARLLKVPEKDWATEPA